MSLPATEHLVFAHGNSFPSATYSVFLDAMRQRGYGVHPIDKVGHNPRFPVSDGWPHLVDELAEHAQQVVQALGQPVWLVGHSLGGYLSLLVASKHPGLVRGVVLVDSPVLGGWRSKVVAGGKRLGLNQRFSPGVVSRKRRNTWPHEQAVLEHFASKPLFASWHPQCLRDYVQYGTADHQGQRVLVFDRTVETAIYDALPHDMPQRLRRSGLQRPVSYVGGLASNEARRTGLAATRRITQGRMQMLEGSHLLPLENPFATAAAVESALRGMGSLR
ncbi:alpha/beta hydrolase [Curvibacter sp. CHRR-16]|uniref:alpha/beta fold hydrolase n=1 Tax=Curvibacter sp. CHRR-16 TaxID=2835872 RepID=UPI001BD92E1D|nr:alpha/beta hydrolase [Curvibacter sp. CHRR-16]MBT0570755.1 alpha/beta hydrolase [Curvibacter sp. CHRR-16]